MPYCESCKEFQEKIINGKFGLWFGYCLKFKIGRSIDSDVCNNYLRNDSFEEIISLRPDIKLERLNEFFE